jgi:hypothetical protein
LFGSGTRLELEDRTLLHFLLRGRLAVLLDVLDQPLLLVDLDACAMTISSANLRARTLPIWERPL